MTDALWAVAVGGAAFAVYLRTLAPGLVAVVDTPMFQFIGRVLGVAHNPGYPLYVLLTFPFSYLPIGALPYRINLFSAILGAITASLTFLVARRLGSRRVVSAAAALAMAFGHIFWSQAVIAEVYTLHAALIAGVLLALLSWRQTGRPGFFYAAMALFAAGLGNHTTILGFAPGIALYVAMTNRQFAFRARTLAVTALILVAGLLQYGFIIVRSRQPGTYVESRATTIGELVDVMRGQQFSDRLFAFDWRTVMFERVPWLVERILTPELTVAGLALAIVGAVWLLLRSLPEGVLLLLGGLIVSAFAVNYSVVDTPVFLIPTTLVLWMTAAVGGERMVRMVEGRRWAVMLVAGATLILPGWQLARNFAVTDRSHDTAAATTFDRLFEAVPDRTEFVHEDFLVDRMLMFKLLGDRSAGTRHISMAPRNASALLKRHAAGFNIFGFQRAVRRLRYDGFNFSFQPLPLLDGSLTEVLPRLSDGTIVAIVVPAAYVERFATPALSLAAIGGPDRITAGAANVAIVGVRGVRNGALVQTADGDLHVQLPAGEEIGNTGVTLPAPIEIRSNFTEATIRRSSRDLVRSDAGVVMAVFNANGALRQTFVLQAADEFRVPIPSSSLSVYPLRGTWPHQGLSAAGWTNVSSAVQTGSTMVKAASGSAAVIYLGSSSPLLPRLIDRSSSRAAAEITSDITLDSDGLGSSPLKQAKHVYRIAIAGPSRDSASLLVALGGIPSHAFGRIVKGGPSSTATIYGIDTKGLLRTPDRASEVLLMARDDQEQLTGDGWSSVEWDSVSTYRWMTNTEAHIVLPIAKPDAHRIRIQAVLEEGGAPRTVALRINGIDLPSQLLLAGWNAYEWTVPPGMAESPANDVVVVVDQLSPPKGDTPARGIAVTEIRVIHGV